MQLLHTGLLLVCLLVWQSTALAASPFKPPNRHWLKFNLPSGKVAIKLNPQKITPASRKGGHACSRGLCYHPATASCQQPAVGGRICWTVPLPIPEGQLNNSRRLTNPRRWQQQISHKLNTMSCGVKVTSTENLRRWWRVSIAMCTIL